ncbi:MAG: thiamine-phosphate kinase, partial [Desulfatibacillaceae bacterium]|nr:thiamine-phosphate kinase [Desulfatibacillaceae bacterium]
MARPLGEFEIIEQIKKALPKKAQGVVCGPQDDAAVLETPSGMVMLATCDVLVQGVHFADEALENPWQLGTKAAAVNISDIAAMGGEPAYLLISLGLPSNISPSFIDDLYKGLGQTGARFGASVAGGNISKSPGQLFIDVFCIGFAHPTQVLYRNGAKTGDVVAVSGTPGDSAAGLNFLLNKQTTQLDAAMQRLVRAHQTPEPKVALGRILAQSKVVNAALDISDGIVSDLGHICESSGLGAKIFAEKLPLSHEALTLAGVLNCDAIDWALYGGEDYELLFTTAPKDFGHLKEKVKKELGLELTIIGEMTAENKTVSVVDADGKIRTSKSRGWD